MNLPESVDRYLDSRSKGSRGGYYRGTAASELRRWLDWLDRRDWADFGVLGDGERGPQVMRRYAQRLAQRARADDGIEPSTARTYYACVRAFLSWCVRDGLLDRNPAKTDRATEELPEDLGERRQQFWSPEQRREIVAFVDERAERAAADAEGPDPITAARDRALVSLLAYAGVRGAEVFRATADDRPGRQGLTWADVDLDAGTIRVLGKAQEYEHAALPRQARGPVRRHRERLDPPVDAWPVFPTGHAPSRYRAARDGLADRGLSAPEIDSLLDDRAVDDVLREYEIPPPAITTTGARHLMRRLCDACGIDVDGEYLTLHGARRGIGDTLYRLDRGRAQDHLRHRSQRTTREAYSYVDASEESEAVSDLLDELGE